MRLQLALNVANIDEAVNYYGKLFDAKPHKRREGYANFVIDNPPLKLVLFENPDAAERLNHLGVEVFAEQDLEKIAIRLKTNDLFSHNENNSVCCHAKQNKIWSKELQGLAWEWYRITDDNPQTVDHTIKPSSCCSLDTTTATACCS